VDAPVEVAFAIVGLLPFLPVISNDLLASPRRTQRHPANAVAAAATF